MARRFLPPLAWLAAVALVLPHAAALAADAAGDKVPITDPALLARLGFEPDATDVYATPQAYEQLLMSPAERAVLQQELDRAERQAAQGGASAGGPFGTSTPGWSVINGRSFYPMHGPSAYGTGSNDGRYCVSGNPFFRGELGSLPHGGRFESLRAWFYDFSADEDMEVTIRRLCKPDFGPGTASVTVLGSMSSSGSSLNQSGSTPIDVDIDLQSCAYEVWVRLDDLNGECSEGVDLSIQKVRAQWRRQVSPAPVTATFADVPTDHPFFRHVEALAASGITAGCGGGDFCPDGSLTRGQMAVFLAKALGLHWGEIP